MAWLQNLVYSSKKNKFHLSSFYFKILHALLSTLTPFATTMTAPHCCHFCTDLDTTSYTSALVFSRAEDLCVFRSSCLIAGLQKKTTCRSALF